MSSKNKILKFNTFKSLNEHYSSFSDGKKIEDSVEIFKWIFIDLIDLGFDFKVESVYTNIENGKIEYSRELDADYKKPGFVIKLYKVFPNIKHSDISEVSNILEGTDSRISEIGTYTLDSMNISGSKGTFYISYLVVDERESDIEFNQEIGMDFLYNLFRRKIIERNSKISRMFKITRSKEGLDLVREDDTINIESAKNDIRKFVRDTIYKNRYKSLELRDKDFLYDLEFQKDRVKLIFKGVE